MQHCENWAMHKICKLNKKSTVKECSSNKYIRRSSQMQNYNKIIFQCSQTIFQKKAEKNMNRKNKKTTEFFKGLR
jgi:hypothetical protein